MALYVNKYLALRHNMLYAVATMFVDTSKSTQRGKTYARHLLRESYREGGKVKHRTVANISHCSAEEVAAIRLALRHKKDLSQLGIASEDITIEQGASLGALLTVYQIAERLGIVDALGSTRQGKLALFQVFARILDHGSRLSSVRFAKEHAIAEILGLSRFNEDDLYKNLDWCSQNQESIENHLFSIKQKSSEFFLYDVTSSYFEGTKNELAAYGYNRDGKNGKMQVVAGLLCDAEGDPVAIELFPGNTSDQETVQSQVAKLNSRFQAKTLTLVGDRGMIKSSQIKLFEESGMQMSYITAITKPQIRSLLNKGLFPMSLFDTELAEVTEGDVRYILKRNPMRAEDIMRSREAKKGSLLKKICRQNEYLETHPRANPVKAAARMNAIANRLRIDSWATVVLTDRILSLEVSEQALARESELDGCYCLKTNLSEENISKELVHSRYKDLALVEQAFRTAKTSFLEIRPIFVIKKSRTQGHALVTMLAYKIIRELRRLWANIDITVQEGLTQLATLCISSVKSKNSIAFHTVQKPRPLLKELLSAANVQVPTAINPQGANVYTRKKLQIAENVN